MEKLDETIERFSQNAKYERTHGNLQSSLEFRQLAKWLKELRVYRENTGWTPVSERLPMKGEAFDDGDVLVSCEDGMVRLGFCMGADEAGEREWCIGGKKYSEPIAWMPLPEPYKAESEDEE